MEREQPNKQLFFCARPEDIQEQVDKVAVHPECADATHVALLLLGIAVRGVKQLRGRVEDRQAMPRARESGKLEELGNRIEKVEDLRKKKKKKRGDDGSMIETVRQCFLILEYSGMMGEEMNPV